MSSGQCVWTLLDADADYHPTTACGGDDFDDSDPARYGGAPDICDGKDNDGDGTVDQTPQAHAMCRALAGVVAATCVNGACNITECTGTLGDCDGNPLNGCETDTFMSNDHCGACGYSCGYCFGGECPTPACTSYRDGEALRREYYGETIRELLTSYCAAVCGGINDQVCLATCAVELSAGDLTDACAECIAMEPTCTASCAPCASEEECNECVCNSQCYQDALACSGRPMLMCNE